MLQGAMDVFTSADQGVQVLVGIGLTLVAAVLAGQLANRCHLPKITGYIAVGVLTGPYGLGILSAELVTEHLRIFADIALMIIAFSVGKLVDFRYLRYDLKRPLIIPAAEAFGAFILVTGGVLAISTLPIDILPGDGGFLHFTLPLALLLGAISMSTAPASTVAIIKECGGESMLGRCLMTSVAVDNALAISFFGIAAVITEGVLLPDSSGSTITASLLTAGGQVLGALLWGALVAIVIHPVIERAGEHGPTLMLTLGAVLFCTGGAHLLTFSPILAGVSLGITMSNSYRADRAAFESIEKFEPPMFAMFFIIAGAHFDFGGFAGVLGALTVYIVARVAGKMLASTLATRMLKTEKCLQNFFAYTLIPQSAIAISLVFTIQSTPALEPFEGIVTNVVLAAVAILETIGPPLTHQALQRSQEHELTEAHEMACEEYQTRNECEPQ